MMYVVNIDKGFQGAKLGDVIALPKGDAQEWVELGWLVPAPPEPTEKPRRRMATEEVVMTIEETE